VLTCVMPALPFVFVFGLAALRVGVAGRNGPAEMGSGGRARGHSEGRDFFPLAPKRGAGFFRGGV
jgi:hypothetical protein